MRQQEVHTHTYRHTHTLSLSHTHKYSHTHTEIENKSHCLRNTRYNIELKRLNNVGINKLQQFI
jgi:hypothetical protein